MKPNYINRKRAFTLTELLIVVIVIGVLAAVTLPKFNRVIENRKVTEAEEMMAAVRTEQERRCALDQNYTQQFANLTDIIASGSTKNYTYNLTDPALKGQGIAAASTSGGYTLKMLSYQDGGICCTGDGCQKLNKNYPDCATLNFPESDCKGTDGGNEAAPDPVPPPSCDNTPRPADQTKDCACGQVSASYYCNESTNYTWKLGEFPECPSKPEDVKETCPCGEERTQTFSCVNGKYEGKWSAECKTECPCEEKIEAVGAGTESSIDTCDGDKLARYSCDGHFNGTCRDVYLIRDGLTITWNRTDDNKFSFYFETAEGGYTPCPYPGVPNNVCPPGWMCEGPSGLCIQGERPADPIPCQIGYVWNEKTQQCEKLPTACPKGYTWNAKTQKCEIEGLSYSIRKVTCCGDGKPPMVSQECSPGETETRKEACSVGSSSQKTCTRTCSTAGKWGLWTCDESACKKIRCLTDVKCHGNPLGCPGSRWQHAEYTMDMMQQTGAISLTTCKLGQECDCEVGKTYLYYWMMGCCAGEKYCTSYSSYVYHSAKCSEVDSLSRCATGNIEGYNASNPNCIGGSGLTPQPMYEYKWVKTGEEIQLNCGNAQAYTSCAGGSTAGDIINACDAGHAGDTCQVGQAAGDARCKVLKFTCQRVDDGGQLAIPDPW